MANGWMDAGTGEVIEAAAILAAADRIRGRRKARSPFGPRWYKMAMLAVEKLATLNLTALQMRALLYAFSTIHDGNCVTINQATMARALGSTQPSISVTIRSLVDANVLIRTDDRSGKFAVYHVSPLVAWYGADNEAHAQAVKRARALRHPSEAKSSLDRAIPKIAKAAKKPLELTTGGAMLRERTVEVDEYTQA